MDPVLLLPAIAGLAAGRVGGGPSAATMSVEVHSPFVSPTFALAPPLGTWTARTHIDVDAPMGVEWSLTVEIMGLHRVPDVRATGEAGSWGLGAGSVEVVGPRTFSEGVAQEVARGTGSRSGLVFDLILQTEHPPVPGDYPLSVFYQVEPR